MYFRDRHYLKRGSLILSDFFSLLSASVLSIAFYSFLTGKSFVRDYIQVVFFLSILSFSSYAVSGLYRPVPRSTATELRALTMASSLPLFVFALASYWLFILQHFPPMLISIYWLFLILITPFYRFSTRMFLIHNNLWLERVVVFDYDGKAFQLIKELTHKAALGLQPVMIVSDNHQALASDTIQVISLQTMLSDPDILLSARANTAILLSGEMNPVLKNILFYQQRYFRRLILVPRARDISSLGVTPLDLNGKIGLQVRQNLLDGRVQLIKRFIDIVSVLVGGLLISPIFLILAGLIKKDSPGPVFYWHTRIGRNGKLFKALKFRTMVINADEILVHYLQENPELRAEWEADHKLKEDPRITRIGERLRKYSLDELPQLWNVLKGEMSLVGPRPIVEDEVSKYGMSFELYCNVLPGLTGMWQVSGRNDTTYEERVRLDEYYVRNWSIWLDIFILIKTIWVVIRRDGAY